MKKPQFVNGQIYHIYNRGVEKRDIFLDDKDRFRFIHDLFEFNDETPATNLYYKSQALKSYEVELRKMGMREVIVEILAFCMMPNHFHLILRQVKDNGIVKFMQKLGTGYTNSFNKKYERVGCLFQGSFKAKLVENNTHLMHLPFYIHGNPIDLFNKSNSSVKEQRKFLESYRWSSFMDYIGIKNFPSVINKEFLLELFGSEKEFLNETEKWLKNKEDSVIEIKDIKID